MQSLVTGGHVRVDGHPSKPGYRLRVGQVVRYHLRHAPLPDVIPESIPLQILHEDTDLVVVNKHAGMVVHPAGPLRHGTLVNALLSRYGHRDVPGGPDRPGIVHRLDKGTSGLMVVALSERAYYGLVAQISSRQVARTYRAIVWGRVVDNHGMVDQPIGRSHRDRKKMATIADGKPAHTSFTVMHRWSQGSELKVSLHTGRTHQIRVHMAWMGHPVVGDGDYGGRRSALSHLSPGRQRAARELLRIIDRPALHAWRLQFSHPIGGHPLEFEAPLPDDFEALRRAMDAP